MRILAAIHPPTITRAILKSRTQLSDGVSWTVPTIVRDRLYALDLGRIVALDPG